MGKATAIKSVINILLNSAFFMLVIDPLFGFNANPWTVFAVVTWFEIFNVLLVSKVTVHVNNKE